MEQYFVIYRATTYGTYQYDDFICSIPCIATKQSHYIDYNPNKKKMWGNFRPLSLHYK